MEVLDSVSGQRGVSRCVRTWIKLTLEYPFNAAVLSRKILVKAEYRIGTPYRQILNIKGLGSDQGKKKNLIDLTDFSPVQFAQTERRKTSGSFSLNLGKRYKLLTTSGDLDAEDEVSFPSQNIPRKLTISD